jgi:XapX domain-containing protein
MRDYVVSLSAGMLVGCIYALLDVHSPAPPAVALVGLLGMLIGGQIMPIARRLWRKEFSLKWFSNECVPNITGVSPEDAGREDATRPTAPPRP